ncbi:PREDICTED: transmembrane protein 5-like [Branchiostoma belcheri]|uniref:Transmembrane protein 5-like n=1 Tax=Branchiostoma belcheri TaxID=7741 RepID=A0A6P4XSC1_BRABE|nr:PREDICTED: transmembrane protein 5-like [Branchiostoma belcheri]
MRVTVRRVVLVAVGIYCLLTFYTAYILLSRNWKGDVDKTSPHGKEKLLVPDQETINRRSQQKRGEDEWNPWGEEFEKNRIKTVAPKKKEVSWDWNKDLDFGKKFNKKKNSTDDEFEIEVWGKAAIGLYLWEFILGGTLEEKMGGIWTYGFKRIYKLKFKFRTGPGVIPSKAPHDTRNLILVLNGREQSKIEFATIWLDYLPSFPYLQNVAVFLLGNEQCDNDWIKPYLKRNGGMVDLLFVVYDSKWVDDEVVFQWPLGVATYRKFPKRDKDDFPVNSIRPYLCNFVGTVYPNSSRQGLMEVINKLDLQKECFVKAREEWSPDESPETRQQYVKALLQSDLTLSPVGQNTECYRIYEACEYGSIPVIEDNMTPGSCGNNEKYNNAPLRLLKQHKPPFIFIKDWSELPTVLEEHRMLSPQDKVVRRRKVLEWCDKFKGKMKDRFLRIINQKFFPKKKQP